MSNSLQYFYTGSSEVPNFPEFVVVGMVNNVQMMHYDSSTSRAVPKQDWMSKVTDAQYWDTETEGFNNTRQLFRDSIEIAQWRFIQTGGLFMMNLFHIPCYPSPNLYPLPQFYSPEDLTCILSLSPLDTNPVSHSKVIRSMK